MATMLTAEREQAPDITLTVGPEALAELGLVVPPPVGTRYKIKGEAEVTAAEGGAVMLSFEKLYLMHEIEAEDAAARMYPGMAG